MISIQDLLLPNEDPPTHDERMEEKTMDPVKLAAEKTTRFQIEFILDTICPHCYIGLKNLTAAMQIHQEKYPDDTFEVTFSPVLISRAVSRSAYDKGTFYVSCGWPSSQLGDWANLGAAAGVAFSWRGRTGNSRDSHKLLRFALEDKPSTMRSTAFAQRRRQQPPPQSYQQTMMGSTPSTATATATTPFPYCTPTATSSRGIPCVPGITPTHIPIPTSTQIPTTTTYDPSANTQPQLQPQSRGPALQLRLAHAIFKGYFEEDRDLSDRGFLAEVGAAVTGYSAAEILRTCLSEEEDDDDDDDDDSDGNEDEKKKKEKEKEMMKDENDEGGGGGSEGGNPWSRTIDALEADVRARGIDAVPTIIVQDRYLAGGWQEARLLVTLFESIRNGDGETSPGWLNSAAAAPQPPFD